MIYNLQFENSARSARGIEQGPAVPAGPSCGGGMEWASESYDPRRVSTPHGAGLCGGYARVVTPTAYAVGWKMLSPQGG